MYMSFIDGIRRALETPYSNPFKFMNSSTNSFSFNFLMEGKT